MCGRDAEAELQYAERVLGLVSERPPVVAREGRRDTWGLAVFAEHIAQARASLSGRGPRLRHVEFAREAERDARALLSRALGLIYEDLDRELADEPSLVRTFGNRSALQTWSTASVFDATVALLRAAHEHPDVAARVGLEPAQFDALATLGNHLARCDIEREVVMPWDPVHPAALVRRARAEAAFLLLFWRRV